MWKQTVQDDEYMLWHHNLLNHDCFPTSVPSTECSDFLSWTSYRNRYVFLSLSLKRLFLSKACGESSRDLTAWRQSGQCFFL